MDATQNFEGGGGRISDNLSPIKQTPAGEHREIIQHISSRLAHIHDRLSLERDKDPQFYDNALQLHGDPTEDPLAEFLHALGKFLKPSNDWMDKLVAASNAAEAALITDTDTDTDTDTASPAAVNGDIDAASTAATDGDTDVDEMSDGASEAGGDFRDAIAGPVFGPQTYFEYLTDVEDIDAGERAWARVLGCMHNLFHSWKGELERAIVQLDESADAVGDGGQEMQEMGEEVHVQWK
ncbi:hypothetical protein R3P38DRAFT_2785926 [Favolaschia claudopus]|uniref:Uncharacterized protein n=1 Tax=Favolaschia claudopus TaxID=2862362 RepID=A0AAW0ATV2_9AGAR